MNLSRQALEGITRREFQRFAKEFPTAYALEIYLKNHPKADKSKHWVKEDKEKGKQDEDETEKQPKGKPEEGKPEEGKPEEGKPEEGKPEEGKPSRDPDREQPDTEIQDFVGRGDRNSVQRVVSWAAEGKSPPLRDLLTAPRLIYQALSDKKISDKDKEKLTALNDWLQRFVGPDRDEDEYQRRIEQAKDRGLDTVMVRTSDIPDKALKILADTDLNEWSARDIQRYGIQSWKKRSRRRKENANAQRALGDVLSSKGLLHSDAKAISGKSSELIAKHKKLLDKWKKEKEEWDTKKTLDEKNGTNKAGKPPPKPSAPSAANVRAHLIDGASPMEAERYRRLSDEDIQTITEGAPEPEPSPDELQEDYLRNSQLDPDEEDRIREMDPSLFVTLMTDIWNDQDLKQKGRRTLKKSPAVRKPSGKKALDQESIIRKAVEELRRRMSS